MAGSREPEGLNSAKPFPSLLGTWQWLSFSCFVMGGTIPEFSLGLRCRGGRHQVMVSAAAARWAVPRECFARPVSETSGMLTRQV